MSQKKRCLPLVMAVCLLLASCGETKEAAPALLTPVGVALDTALVTRGNVEEITFVEGAVSPASMPLSFTGGGVLKEVLVVVGDGILNREWLFGHSSDDEQQYAIQGQVIDPGLVEDGNASGEDAAGVLTTTDWDAAVAFLGMEPTVPTRLPEGWSVKQYHATRFDDELILNVSYIK